MIIDLSKSEGDPFEGRQFDICICGAGVAGITLALNLSGKMNVLLLEGGGFENSAETQSIYQGNNVGREYADLRAGRLRFFGGSSNHWGGECRPLDAHDFETKTYLPLSGWPIGKSDLDPYAEKAESIVDLPAEESWDAPPGYFEDRIGNRPDFRSIRYKLSPPTRFGEKYRNEIESRSNIVCVLNANVTDFRLAENGKRIRHAVVRTYSGVEYFAPARTFVLATGGVENARLLLNSNSQVSAGLGNRHGNVGRFFSEHLYTKVADFILEDEARTFVEQYPYGDSFKGRLKSQICAHPQLHEMFEDMRGRDMDCLSEIQHYFAPTREMMQLNEILNFSLRMRVRTPGHGEPTDGKLFIASEQAPNPESRITLGNEKDMLGLRRVDLDWQLSTIDVDTIRRATFRFGEALADLSIGRLRVVDWIASESRPFEGTYGHHHMCTTRMGTTPQDAVVDSNSKLFGTDNLYVVGSSVFATAGQANPTFTIVQLTLRLADHLGSRG
jgi:choline dehydrogenase-like flavoprotein